MKYNHVVRLARVGRVSNVFLLSRALLLSSSVDTLPEVSTRKTMYACLFLLRIADDTGLFGNTGEESEAHIMRRTLAFFRGESLSKQAGSLKLRMSPI